MPDVELPESLDDADVAPAPAEVELDRVVVDVMVDTADVVETDPFTILEEFVARYCWNVGKEYVVSS